MKQQTERCVKITNYQRECSFEQKRSSRNKRKILLSAEESKKNKYNIKIDDFFQNASILPDGSDSEGIRSTKPAYKTSEETGNNDRKEKMKGMARLQKEVEGISQIHLPKRKLKKK